MSCVPLGITRDATARAIDRPAESGKMRRRGREKRLAKWDVEQHVHSAGQTGWPDRIHAVFRRHAIRQVGYVPDTVHARLTELCIKDNEIKDVLLA